MNRTFRWFQLGIVCATVLVVPSAVCAATFVWQASSGLTPDAVTDGLTLFDSASPENPLISGGKLTLSTSTGAEDMYYLHQGSMMSISDLPQIDFRMKYVSGSFSGARAPAMIAFGVGAGVGAQVLLKQDLVQTSDANGSTIVQSASVDTDDAFHDYRISLSGTSDGSAFTVYQDNVALFSDVLGTRVASFGTTPNVAFGDMSSVAFGVSEWESFSHNMLVPEPSRMVLIAAGLVGLTMRRRRLPSTTEA